MQVENYILLEQTKAIYKNRRLILFGIIVTSLATTWMFWPAFSKSYLLLWFGLSVLIAGLRWFTSREFQPDACTPADCRRWLNVQLFWALMSGLHWGLVPVFFLSSDTTIYTLFVTMVYVGYSSTSALSISSCYLPLFYALATPATVMFAGRFFYEGGEFYTPLGFMIIFHWAMNIVVSRNTYQLFHEAKQVDYKNVLLMENLVVQKDAAEQATLSKNQFLAAASHDLRQPLHASGLLLSALDRHVSSDEGKEILHEIHSSTQALNHSFKSLLDVSKLDAGVVEANFQNLSLGQFMSSFKRDYQIQAQQQGIEFKAEGEDISIYSDLVLLERVLHNLLSNALRYTYSGRVQMHWALTQDGRIKLLIKDTGIGIASDELQHIFSEYYQINNPERDRDKGFGLGLAIVKRLCEMLSIQLYVSSQMKVGTIFALYLPSGDQSKVGSAQSSVQNKVELDLNGVRILVIDDDASVRKSMKTLLDFWNCDAVLAESQEQALEQVTRLDLSLDIIIADYRLRDNKTGVDAIKRIYEELNQTIPAIIITGDTSPDRLQSITASGFPVLHKPVSAVILRSAVQRQLIVDAGTDTSGSQ